MTAQIFLVFEKLRFYDFFRFFDQKTDTKKTELQILNSIGGCCQSSFSSCKSGV